MNKRTKHIMNEKDEIRRVDKEIRKNEGYMKGGKVKGYDGGGKVTMTSMKKDKKKKMTAKQMATAAKIGAKIGVPGKTGGSHALMKAKGKKMMMGGKVKKYQGGGAVGSASKRADGCARKGKTKGRMV